MCIVHIYSVIFAHPLFIAQDPNLYWPIIFDHGCIRAALEHVAPHIDWIDRLGPIIAPPTLSSVVPGITTPGTSLRRCGNEACLRVEVDESQSKKKARGETSMMKCGRCSRRVYCSKVISPLVIYPLVINPLCNIPPCNIPLCNEPPCNIPHPLPSLSLTLTSPCNMLINLLSNICTLSYISPLIHLPLLYPPPPLI